MSGAFIYKTRKTTEFLQTYLSPVEFIGLTTDRDRLKALEKLMADSDKQEALMKSGVLSEWLSFFRDREIYVFGYVNPLYWVQLGVLSLIYKLAPYSVAMKDYLGEIGCIEDFSNWMQPVGQQLEILKLGSEILMALTEGHPANTKRAELFSPAAVTEKASKARKKALGSGELPSASEIAKVGVRFQASPEADARSSSVQLVPNHSMSKANPLVSSASKRRSKKRSAPVGITPPQQPTTISSPMTPYPPAALGIKASRAASAPTVPPAPPPPAVHFLVWVFMDLMKDFWSKTPMPSRQEEFDNFLEGLLTHFAPYIGTQVDCRVEGDPLPKIEKLTWEKTLNFLKTDDKKSIFGAKEWNDSIHQLLKHSLDEHYSKEEERPRKSGVGTRKWRIFRYADYNEALCALHLMQMILKDRLHIDEARLKVAFPSGFSFELTDEQFRLISTLAVNGPQASASALAAASPPVVRFSRTLSLPGPLMPESEKIKKLISDGKPMDDLKSLFESFMKLHGSLFLPQAMHRFITQMILYFGKLIAESTLIDDPSKQPVLLTFPRLKQYLINTQLPKLELLIKKYCFTLALNIFPNHFQEIKSPDGSSRRMLYLYETRERAQQDQYFLAFLLDDAQLNHPGAAFEVSVIEELKQQFCFSLSIEEHSQFETLRISRRLMKSLRWDKYAFLAAFIKSITHAADKTIEPRDELRFGPRKEHTVWGTGILSKGGKPPRLYTVEDQALLSRKQSTTVVTRDTQPALFKSGQDEVGIFISFDLQFAMLGRLFTKNASSIGRPYDHDSLDTAKQYENMMVKGGMLFDDLEAFLQKLKMMPEAASIHNEVMAAVAYVLGSTCVGIERDNFESRCAAQILAKELMDAVILRQEKLGMPCLPGEVVPIFYYLRNNPLLNFRAYESVKQLSDREHGFSLVKGETAEKITLREHHFQRKQFSFLVLAAQSGDPDLVRQVMALTWKEKPVILHIILEGLFHISDLILRYKPEGRIDSLEYLKNYGASHRGQKLISPESEVLFAALKQKNLSMLDLLIQLGGSIHRCDQLTGDSLIYTVAQSGDLEGLTYLLTWSEIEVSQMHSKLKRTPLYTALLLGHDPIVLKLLEYPKLVIEPAEVMSILLTLLWKNKVELLSLFIEKAKITAVEIRDLIIGGEKWSKWVCQHRYWKMAGILSCLPSPSHGVPPAVIAVLTSLIQNNVFDVALKVIQYFRLGFSTELERGQLLFLNLSEKLATLQETTPEYKKIFELLRTMVNASTPLELTQDNIGPEKRTPLEHMVFSEELPVDCVKILLQYPNVNFNRPRMDSINAKLDFKLVLLKDEKQKGFPDPQVVKNYQRSLEKLLVVIEWHRCNRSSSLSEVIDGQAVFYESLIRSINEPRLTELFNKAFPPDVVHPPVARLAGSPNALLMAGPWLSSSLIDLTQGQASDGKDSSDGEDDLDVEMLAWLQ